MMYQTSNSIKLNKTEQITMGDKMPSYNEIERKNNPLTTIKKYLEKYRQKTGRNTIIYYSN